MLISMKSYVEGMRSLLYYAGYLSDQMAVTADEAEEARLQAQKEKA